MIKGMVHFSSMPANWIEWMQGLLYVASILYYDIMAIFSGINSCELILC